MTDTALFFQEMEPFHLFHDLVVDDHYIHAPSDWWVIVTDVIGSTVAIENGRYKDVNTIGAATLASIQNATGQLQIPFVFGGDGATALVPGRFKDAVERELSALRSVSQDQFKLELRVGMVSVDELNTLGFPVAVSKYMLKGNYPLAIFRGGALTKAEELIKGGEQSYQVPHHPDSETNLRQLSCRWKPLESTNGTVISLLLMDPRGRPAVYAEFLRELEDILAGDVEQFNPVNISTMNYRTTTEMLQHDVKHQQSLFARLPRMLDTLVATVLFRWGLFKLIPKLRLCRKNARPFGLSKIRRHDSNDSGLQS